MADWSIALKLFVLTAIYMVVYIEANCNIKMEITSESSKPVLLKVVFYNKTETKWQKLRHSGFRIKYHLKDKSCGKRPTELRVLPYYTEGKKQPKYQSTSSFLDGAGTVTYAINDGLFGPYPKMKSRIGVLCAFGDCGRGK